MCCLTWLVFLYLRLVLLRLLLWHLLSFLLASFVLRQATSSLEPTWSCALAALGLLKPMQDERRLALRNPLLFLPLQPP